MRAELVESKSKREILEQELHNLLLQLHTAQLAQIPTVNGNFKQDPGFKPDVNNIKKKLEDELKRSPSHSIKSKITTYEHLSKLIVLVVSSEIIKVQHLKRICNTRVV